jgi:hypothetical protein
MIVVCEVLGVLLAATALWRSGDAHRGVGRAALQRGGSAMTHEIEQSRGCVEAGGLGEFAPSQALTLGVELELQLLNTHHYDMTPYAPDMLALLKNAKVPGSIVPEVTSSMIEISTGICQDAQDAYEQLAVTRDAWSRRPTGSISRWPVAARTRFSNGTSSAFTTSRASRS